MKAKLNFTSFLLEEPQRKHKFASEGLRNPDRQRDDVQTNASRNDQKQIGSISMYANPATAALCHEEVLRDTNAITHRRVFRSGSFSGSQQKLVAVTVYVRRNKQGAFPFCEKDKK